MINQNAPNWGIKFGHAVPTPGSCYKKLSAMFRFSITRSQDPVRMRAMQTDALALHGIGLKPPFTSTRSKASSNNLGIPGNMVTFSTHITGYNEGLPVFLFMPQISLDLLGI